MTRAARPTHPYHSTMRESAPGYWEPAIPLRAPSFWLRLQLERACHKAGGHWWHPVDAMIGWACCRCGKPTDGMPKDGASR